MYKFLFITLFIYRNKNQDKNMFHETKKYCCNVVIRARLVSSVDNQKFETKNNDKNSFIFFSSYINLI